MAQKLTDRTLLSPAIANDDLIHMVDVSDTTQDPAGSSYKAQFSQVLDYIEDNIDEGQFADNKFSIYNAADNTKIATFDASNISTSSTRSYIFPDNNGTIATVNNILGTANEITVTDGGDTATVSFASEVIMTGIQYLRFDTTISHPTFSPGTLHWNADDETLDLDTGTTDVTLQIGQEIQAPKHLNNTGSTITNGQVVFVDENNELQLARADSADLIDRVIGLATHDILTGTQGIITTFGLVRDLNTSSYSTGDQLYVSASTAGALTNVLPEYPNYIMKVATAEDIGTTDGSVLVNVVGRVEDIQENAFNGDFVEPIDLLVSSDGTTVTASLDRTGGGDLTMNFSDGFTILDTTPPATITLTPGSDAIPQKNYIYVPKSTKTLTVSTSDWPDEQHIKVSEVVLRSALATEEDGALGNRNWNDHIAGTDGSGHIQHISERIRQGSAEWDSGAEVTINEVSTTEIYARNTSGVVYQLHRQNFPLLDMTPYAIDAVNQGNKTFTISGDGDLSSTFPDGRIIKVYDSTANDALYTVDSTTYSAPDFIITVEESIPSSTADGFIGDDIHVVNDSINPYETITNIADLTLDALGVALSNSACSFVIWGIQNKGGQESHIMLNLPTGTYARNSPNLAVDDAFNRSVYEIPSIFKGTGFLMARATFQITAGGEWTLYDLEDLRGRIPNTTAGGGGGGTGVTSFLGLSDTPSAYTSQAGNYPKVNSAETALEFTNLFAQIAGTTNQINVSDDGDGTITLSTPQDIDTAAGVTFDTLTLSASQPVLTLDSDSNFDRKIIFSEVGVTRWEIISDNFLSPDNEVLDFVDSSSNSVLTLFQGGDVEIRSGTLTVNDEVFIIDSGNAVLTLQGTDNGEGTIRLFETQPTPQYGFELTYNGSVNQTNLGHYNATSTFRSDITIARSTGNVSIDTGNLTLSLGNLLLQGSSAIAIGGENTDTPDSSPDAQLVLDGAENAGYNLTTKLLIRGFDNETDTKAISCVDEDANEIFVVGSDSTTSGYAYVKGFFGVGSATPTVKLDVKSAAESTDVVRIRRSASSTAIFEITEGSGGYGLVDIYNTSGSIGTRLNSGGDSFFLGQVGFGTSTPSYNIEVSPSAGTDAEIYMKGAGSGDFAVLYIDRGQLSNTKGHIQFRTAGSRIWEFGINEGNTNNLSIQNSAGTDVFTVDSSSNNITIANSLTVSTSLFVNSIDGVSSPLTLDSSDSVVLRFDGTDYLTVDTNGVTCGSGVTLFTDALEVEDTDATLLVKNPASGNTRYAAIRAWSSSDGTPSNNADAILQLAGKNNVSVPDTCWYIGLDGSTGSGSFDPYLKIGFDSGWAVPGDSDLVTITPSGNVGIGETAPDTKLLVKENINGAADINLENPNSGSSAYGIFRFRNNTDGGLIFLQNSSARTTDAGANGALIKNTISGGDIVIETAGGTELRLDDGTGDVSISGSLTLNSDISISANFLLSMQSPSWYCLSSSTTQKTATLVINDPSNNSVDRWVCPTNINFRLISLTRDDDSTSSVTYTVTVENVTKSTSETATIAVTSAEDAYYGFLSDELAFVEGDIMQVKWQITVGSTDGAELLVWVYGSQY